MKYEISRYLMQLKRSPFFYIYIYNFFIVYFFFFFFFFFFLGIETMENDISFLKKREPSQILLNIE